MIVEFTPPPSRPEPARSSASDPKPHGSTTDPFSRTLTDVLSADAGDRRAEPQRSGDEVHGDRSRRPMDRRPVDRGADRGRSDGDDESDRSDDKRRAADPSRADHGGRSDERTADTGPASDGAARPGETGTGRAAERIAELMADGTAEAAGLATALAQLTEGSEPDAGMPPSGGAASETTPPAETVEIDPTLPLDTAGSELPAAPGDATEGAVAASGIEPPDTEPSTAGDQTQSGGRAIADVARDHRGGGLPDIVADLIASSDDPTEPAAGTDTGTTSPASPVAAVARGDIDLPAPDLDTATVLAQAATTTDEATSTLVEDPVGDPASIVTEELPASDANNPLDATADADTGGLIDGAAERTPAATTRPGAEAVNDGEAPTVPATDRSAPPVTPVGPDRATPATLNRPTPADNARPPSELVELRNNPVAEQLRPAFAAVRRGLNGLDELRLRILDDNAGPIKVDIATVDNRVRVLLSAGNEDLMRQLGQERDRLADELRRAGFDQASIDVASERGGERRSGYDGTDTAPGAGGPGHAGEPEAVGSAPIGAAVGRAGRRTAGLDLDL